MIGVFYFWVALCILVIARAQEKDINGLCNPLFHNADAVESTVAKAKELLNRFPSEVPIRDRLAVMILFSKGFTGQSGARLNYLNCALKQFLNRAGKSTPVDIFIWVLEPEDATQSLHVPSWLNTTAFPRVNVIPIPRETWRVPCGLMHESRWNLRRHFDVDYYLMGRWRLTFSLDFARSMGYEYHMQLDDDAVLLSDITYNMVEKLRSSDINMAVNGDFIYENVPVILGLPELTQFWLKMNKFQPIGNILEHCKQKHVTGITSEGWDKGYHPGFWMITRISWWFSENPQSFLETVLRSGKDVEGRWQEQAVMNIMRQIFIPDSRVLVMEPDIGHDRHRKENFVNWCERQGYPPIS
jgi:hypothetical protein